jgi:wobble nucleotide-excising tRNase
MLELSLADIEKCAEMVFNSTSAIDTANIIAHESNPILKKRLTGKEDVDITAMIQKLGNSDWIKAGLTFYKVNDKICPFCQQSTLDTFAKSLSDYFDETFKKDSKDIDELKANYKTDSDRLQHHIDSIIANPPKFIDIEELKSEKLLLGSKIEINIQRLATKSKEPSQIIELESIANITSKIKNLIESANAQIADHNKRVANITQERKNLMTQVWKYLVEEELKADLEAYKTHKDELEKAIELMTVKIDSAKNEMAVKTIEIQKLEKEITSIQPTINEINKLLTSFGFRGFSLAKANNGVCYKLIRPDGTDAKETLSEGEKTFATFLYFYHLLRGSNLENGITTDRVVVFDDPVSSLDSDILFIVGSLIKSLFDEVRAGTGYIKQIFILTHNVYFHKEVTFRKRTNNKAIKDETFWIIRKTNSVSKLEKHNKNPIKTSYQWLWAEVQNPDPSNLTIQNTLRRILENYFKILGNIDNDGVYAKFEGKEKLICKSLFSWVNAGSHDAHEDLYVSIDNSTVEIYLKVFKEIFEKLGHLEHYKMMMENAPPSLSA